MSEGDTRTHLAALLSRLESCKAGETYPLDPYERDLILKEIESLRRQWAEGVSKLLDQVAENKRIIDEANASLNARGRP